MKTFRKVKPTNWGIILLALVGFAFLTWLINEVVFPSDVLDSVTSSLFQGTLVVNLFGFAVIIVGIVTGLGKLRWRDIGFEPSKIAKGAFYALAYWLALQSVLLFVGIFESGSVQLNSTWETRNVSLIIGLLIAQVFGTALKEEAFYRGFLLPQLFLKFKRGKRDKLLFYLAGAILVSSLIFALMHIPSVIRFENSIQRSLFIHTVGGIVYSLFYIYSGNLFFVIGVHALSNWNMSIFETDVPGGLVSFAFKVLFVLAWTALLAYRRKKHKER